MEEFMEFCRHRSETDGQYAIAYAIMLTGRPMIRVPGIGSSRTSGVEGKGTQPVMKIEEVRARMIDWLIETGIRRFCLLDAWVMGFAESEKDYSMLNAKVFAKAARSIPGVEQGTKQIFARWGQQRGYTFTPQTEESPDDLGI